MTQPSSPPAAPPPASLFSERNFAQFWFARVFSTVAYAMQAVALGWQLYAITGSAFDLGLIGLVQFVPMVFLTLVVGHMADRYDRRRIVAICQYIEAGCAAVLVVGTAGGWLGREGILALAAVIGSARALDRKSVV